MERRDTLSARDLSKLHDLQIGLSDGKYKSLSNSVMRQLADLCPSKITMWIYLLHRSTKENLDPSLVEIMNRNDTIAGAAMEVIECDYTCNPGY